MTRIKLSENGATAFEKLIGHNANILEKWNQLDNILWSKTLLDKNLIEQIRRTMAFNNACEYCMVKEGKANFDKSNLKISISTAFAELFCRDHTSIADGHFNSLREFYTDREISELIVFIAFIDASQKIGKTFNLTEDLQRNAVVSLNELKKDK